MVRDRHIINAELHLFGTQFVTQASSLRGNYTTSSTKRTIGILLNFTSIDRTLSIISSNIPINIPIHESSSSSLFDLIAMVHDIG